MTLHWYYAPFYLSVVLLFAGLLRRDWKGTFAASILIIDWAACTKLADVSGTQFEWSVTALIDCFAAWALIIPNSRREAILSGTFVLEVLAHLAYGLHVVMSGASGDADTAYWWTLFSIACAQCVYLGWGVINGGGKKRRMGHRAGYVLSRQPEDYICDFQRRGPRG